MNKFISLKEKDETKMYSILSKISSGNNKNDLYRVKHKKTGKIYAAKIIKHNLDIYHKQIKLLKKFENPYIVQYYNSYEFKNKIWIITELCDCGSVQDIMKITNKCYKEAEIASIIVMVLKALQYLHLQKKFHGGIKSSNILVNNDGIIKLSDSFISEQLLNDDNSQIKNDIEKIPPELIGKNKLENFSVKSDIWYLGLTCIELAEGSLDFTNGKILSEKNDKNGSKNNNLWSLDFIDFIQKCLNKNPLKRPSAASLLNHPFIVNNNKGKIIIKKKINSIKALIDIYREKIDEQEEKINLNEIEKDSLETTSLNDNLNKSQSEDINFKKNSVSLNTNKNRYKNKSLLINRNQQIIKYKQIKKFNLGSKSIQIQKTSKKNNYFFNNNNNKSNKTSSKKKNFKTSIIKKVINSDEIFAINTTSLRKKRQLLIDKYLKNGFKLNEYCNEIINDKKLNNTIDNIHRGNNLMQLLNKFDRDKKGKNKILNKSQRMQNIENIYNMLNKETKINNAIKKTNISKNVNNYTLSSKGKKKTNDKSLSSIDSKSKNLNNTENNNDLKAKTRNKKSNGGNPSLSDLNENNNKNWKKTTQKKNKMLRNLLLGDKEKELQKDNNIINSNNKKGIKMSNNDIKIYNNEYIFKISNSANIYHKYIKKREKDDNKFQDMQKNHKLNKTSKIQNIYYLNTSEIKKIHKTSFTNTTKKNKIIKKKLKNLDKINYKINTHNINNNINEQFNTYNDSYQENEKSDYIFNINNTDININVNNITNTSYFNTTNSKYNNKTYLYNTNQNTSILSEEDIKHLVLNKKLNERELPELITELAGLENKMNKEIQKIREEYEPIIMQHKEGIKFLKQNPFLKNIKEYKHFESFKNRMKCNNNDDFDSRSVSSNVHNLNKIKISFYRANDIEELNISANKYAFDRTGYYN